jgi:hypothetical protein
MGDRQLAWMVRVRYGITKYARGWVGKVKNTINGAESGEMQILLRPG